MTGTVFYALMGIVWLAYRPGLGGGLVFDDLINLEPLADFDNGLLTWRELVSGNVSGPLGRPLAMLTFAFNVAASGTDVWSYKFTNLAVHLLCGCLVFWLSGRLFRNVQELAAHRWSWALWVAGLWLCSPLFVSTVLYVIQRMAQLSALFTFAGLLLYAVGRQNIDGRFAGGAVLILSAFVICWPAATFSKETGALFPLLAWITEIFIFRFQGPPRVRRLLRALYFVTLAVPAAVVLIVVLLKPDLVLAGYQFRDFTLSERLYTEARILFDYLRQLLLPRGGAMGLYHDDFPRSTGLFSPPLTMAALLSWCALLLAGWWSRNTRARMLGFAVFFFLGAQLLESTAYPLELYFEHRNYLAGYGIYAGLAAAMAVILERMNKARGILTPCLITMPLLFALATSQRVLAWQSPAQDLLITEAHHAQSPRVSMDLALWFAGIGDFADAEERLERADELRPEDSGVALVRLLVRCSEGRPVTSGDYARLQAVRDISQDITTTAALQWLVKKLRANQCHEVDTEYLADTITRWWLHTRRPANDNTQWNLHIAMADLYRQARRYDAALAHLYAALEIQPQLLHPELVAADIWIERRNLERAQAVVNDLKRRDRHRQRSQTMLIAAYQRYIDAMRKGPAAPRR